MLDGCRRYDHLLGEAAVESDSTPPSGYKRFSLPSRQNLHSATDIGCDEDRVSNLTCAVVAVLSAISLTTPTISCPGTRSVTPAYAVWVPLTMRTSVPHTPALATLTRTSPAEFPGRTVLDLQLVGSPVDQGLDSHSRPQSPPAMAGSSWSTPH